MTFLITNSYQEVQKNGDRGQNAWLRDKAGWQHWCLNITSALLLSLFLISYTESRCIFNGIKSYLPVMRVDVALIALAPVFSLAWKKMVMQRSRGIPWNIALVTCMFLVYTLAWKQDSWLFPWHTTRKRYITSTLLLLFLQIDMVFGTLFPPNVFYQTELILTG